MNLLLDIGNTTIKWAQAEGTRLLDSGHAAHRDSDFAALAGALWHADEAPQQIVVSNVAGAAMADRVAAWSQRSWGLAPRLVRASSQLAGLRNAYARPETLGSDRWAAMLGARLEHGGALCVVDCGTAITVDFVAADGAHGGGLILAGIDMMQQALQGSTANLRAPAGHGAVSLLARNTGDAIASGSLYAAAAAIDRIAADIAAAEQEPVTTLLTGGDAGRVAALLRTPVHHDPDLVLKGLAVLSEEG